MKDRSLNPDARSLEEAFFADRDADLLRKLKEEARLKERRAALREVAPRADDALLDQLMAMGIGPETVLALILVPLAAVAWADGSIEPAERAAILKAAEERGIKPGTPAGQMLESWLERPPDARLMQNWKTYLDSIWGAFDDDHRRGMHDSLIGMARAVAQAAGGFLGISKISTAERAVLADLEETLRKK
ncbi:MAG: hypothetical protein ACREAA_10020 [Candidatus Polarisedimenticolia bacterium]